MTKERHSMEHRRMAGWTRVWFHNCAWRHTKAVWLWLWRLNGHFVHPDKIVDWFMNGCDGCDFTIGMICNLLNQIVVKFSGNANGINFTIIIYNQFYSLYIFLNKKKIYFFNSSLFQFHRGISSTVRRCIEKETGREFAAKIIDLGIDGGDASSAQMLDATRQEVQILRQVMGHPYISEYITFFHSSIIVTNDNWIP